MKKIRTFEQFGTLNENLTTPQTKEELEEIIDNMTKDSFVDDTVRLRLFKTEHPEWLKPVSEGGRSKEWAQLVHKWHEKGSKFFSDDEFDGVIISAVHKKFAEVTGTEPFELPKQPVYPELSDEDRNIVPYVVDNDDYTKN